MFGGFPKSVFFILGTEFCERFSYYGLRTVLPLYLRSFPGIDADRATSLFAAFTVLAYIAPILGGTLADTSLGKFKTILYFSVSYCIGNIMNAVFAIRSITNNTPYGSFGGLLLIAISTGGIKPNISAFGGDQFGAGQDKQLTSFFSVFYFSINVGSVLATFIAPILRRDVQCFGGDCYPLAFGVPAMLMIVALVFFVLGYSKYKQNPPEGSILVKVYHVVKSALKKMPLFKRGEKSNWLDYAKDDHDVALVDDVKALFDVLYVFAPVPVFWSLYDQQSTRWTFQAIDMDRSTVFNGYELAPEQMHLFNSLFIVIFVPFFDQVVYKYIHIAPLRRMTIGMFFAALSFGVTGTLQLYIDHSATKVSVFLQLPQYVIMTWAEVLVSISGLEFAYSQAPKSMKAVCTAAWLLTVALGNIIVMFVAENRILEQWGEFYLFAGMMFVTAIIFAFMATRVKVRSAFREDESAQQYLINEINEEEKQ